MGQCIQPMPVEDGRHPDEDVLDWNNDTLVGRRSAQNSLYNSKIRLDRSRIWCTLKHRQRVQAGYLLEESPKRNSITFAEELEETILFASDSRSDIDVDSDSGESDQKGTTTSKKKNKMTACKAAVMIGSRQRCYNDSAKGFGNGVTTTSRKHRASIELNTTLVLAWRFCT